MKLNYMLAVVALAVSAPAMAATNITFSGLTGANESALTSYTESGYTFKATGGSLSTLVQYGTKEIGTTSSATVELTFSGGTFTLDVLGGLTGNQTGTASISYLGYLGNSQVSSASYNYSGQTGAMYVAGSKAVVDRIVFSLDHGTAANVSFSASVVSAAAAPAATSAVPESATWAMMLVGFGALGGSIRMGRRTTVNPAS